MEKKRLTKCIYSIKMNPKRSPLGIQYIFRPITKLGQTYDRFRLIFYAYSSDVKRTALPKSEPLSTTRAHTYGLTGDRIWEKHPCQSLISHFSVPLAEQVACLSMDGFHLSKAQLSGIT